MPHDSIHTTRTGESTGRTQTVLAGGGKAVASWAGEVCGGHGPAPRLAAAPRACAGHSGTEACGKVGLDHRWCPAGCSVALYSFKRHALVAHLLCASIAIGPGYVAVTETDKRPRLPRSLLLTGRRLGERRGGGGTSLHREAGRDLAEVATLEQRLEEVQREPCAPPGSRVPPRVWAEGSASAEAKAEQHGGERAGSPWVGGAN